MSQNITSAIAHLQSAMANLADEFFHTNNGNADEVQNVYNLLDRAKYSLHEVIDARKQATFKQLDLTEIKS